MASPIPLQDDLARPLYQLKEEFEVVAKASEQFPADFAPGQKVIAYGNGYQVNAFATAKDLTEINIRIEEGVAAEIRGDKESADEGC